MKLTHTFYVELSEDRNFDAYVEVSLSGDKDFGADADGNRGSHATFAELTYVEFTDQDGLAASKEEQSLLKPIVEALVREYDWENEMIDNFDNEGDYYEDC